MSGLKRGTTTITAVHESTGLSASYKLTVIPGKLSFYYVDSGQKVDKSDVFEIGESFRVYAQDEFNSVSSDEVNFKSSKEEVATINSNGYIKTLDNGNSTITASVEGYSNIKARFTLKVQTAVTDIYLYEDEYVTYASETVPIEYEVEPSNATNKKMLYEIEDKEIASISNGKVPKIKGKKAGTTNVTIKSKSNPEIAQTFTVTVLEERDYKSVYSSDISQDDEYILKYIDVDEEISIRNDYPENAKFSCSDEDVISYEVTEKNIAIKGLKRGVSTLRIRYDGVEEYIKVLVAKYVDDETDVDITSVEKIKFPEIEDENGKLKTIDYTKDNALEVGVATDVNFYISPQEASVEDLQYSISNTDDFKLNKNGTITALNPNKSTKFIVSSKTNPNVSVSINMKSIVGDVAEIEFAHTYVDDLAFDINKNKSYSFTPIFYMENGNVLDPTSENLEDDEVYKSLLKRIKITTEDTDLVKVQNNKLSPIKGQDGLGILTMTFDEGKDTELTAKTNFESIGIVIEDIKSISFVDNKYELDYAGNFAFNPKIITTENRTLDPTKDGVLDSEEYQKFLSQIHLENVDACDDFLATTALVEIIDDNIIGVVHEGKCKLKMIVDGKDISDVTILDINFNRDVESFINNTMYVNVKSASIVSDIKDTNNTEVANIDKATPIWVFEKYKNGWARVSYELNGSLNDQLYVKYSSLSKIKPKVENTSNGSNSSNNVNITNDTSVSSNLKVVSKINDYRYVKASSLNIRNGAGTNYNKIGSFANGAKIYVYEKYENGWCRVKYNNNTGYVSSDYLTLSKQSDVLVSKKTNNKISSVSSSNNKSSNGSSSKIGSKTSNARYASNNMYLYEHKYAGDNPFSGSSYISLKKGKKVTLVNEDSYSGVCEVKYNGKTYYCYSGSLRTTAP